MSLPFVQSLVDAGHTPVSPDESFDLLLIDYDIDYPIYEQFYKRADEEDARILMYPHGAGVLTIWDGQREANPQIDAALVYAPGYAEIMELARRTRKHGWGSLPAINQLANGVLEPTEEAIVAIAYALESFRAFSSASMVFSSSWCSTSGPFGTE